MTERAALNIAKAVARDLVQHGASAVALLGSHARGDAGTQSDIDLYAFGDGPEYRLLRREPFLISVSWRTVEGELELMHSPREAGGIVPGWRDAVALHDPDEQISSLKQFARDWTWDVIDDDTLDRWVADDLAGYAEEVHKLVNALRTGDKLAVGAMTAVLAIRLAFPMAVHHRILYRSENQLWRLVCEVLGEQWTTAQWSAFGLDGDSTENSARSALRLFELACDEVRPLFNDEERAVIEHATALARSERTVGMWNRPR